MSFRMRDKRSCNLWIFRAGFRVFPCFLVLLLAGCGAGKSGSLPTYTVVRGAFVHSVAVSGELEAVNAKMILSPLVSWRTALKITKLVEDGKQVAAGDLLIQFDPSEVQKTISEAQAELEIAEAELRKAQANARSQIEGLEIDLEVAELSHKIAGLQLEQATFDADITRQEKRLALEKAAIALEKAKTDLANQKSVQQQEISKLELQVQQAKSKLEESRETLAKLTVTAPAPGIAIIQKNWTTNAKYQVDEQPYPGWPMIALPDLNQMKADVQISEVDIAKIDTGQAVVVRLDAYPDTSFSGRITHIATLARNKDRNSKVKVFDAVAELDGIDPKLMPGMTVGCEIVVEKLPDTLFVPLEAVFKKEGGTLVYRRSGGGFEPRQVVLGMQNDNYAVVASGLRAGDRVALADPTRAASEQTEAPSNPKRGETP